MSLPRARMAAVATLAAVVATLFAGPGTVGADGYDPASDPYGMGATTAHMGAPAWWDAGYTGKGVDVALIDTGVARVEGLRASGKVIDGPDLSLESQAPNLTRVDTNGHGTFMAGLIAGRDDALTSPNRSAPSGAYRGVAPDARIVSLKVATADGGVDVSQVIAAIYWVIQHKDDKGLRIRVLNLSYGTNSVQPFDLDPLSYAVEQAWKAGIVVVAAAGNSGYQIRNGAPGLANPAHNPRVLAVGGYDMRGTAKLADDVMGPYSASSAGCSSQLKCREPDIVAPGSHLQGLAVPNGFLHASYPGGRLGARWFRGTGTSQAAALTSGAVALVLSKHPALTPDQVKHYLTSNAAALPGEVSAWQGAGRLSLGAMARAVPATDVRLMGRDSSGTGTLEGARGTDHLSRDGVVLSGERDIFGKQFDARAIAAGGGAWSGGVWNGSTWSGSTWSGSTWSGSTWSGSTWSGSTWSGSTWSGSTWSGSTWSGSTWSGSSWSGSTWSGGSWATASWS